MRRSVAFLLFAFVGLAFGDSHNNHHKNHKHHSPSGLRDQSEHYPRPADFAPQYRQQKEYVYQYDTQISTGLSGQQQNAVQRMRAQLRLTFNSENTAVAQLTDWQSARMNEEVHQPISKMISMETLRTTEIPKRHMDLLEKPFEIRYEQGKVVELFFSSQDQVWSENMKRAAINAFQLRMDIEDRNTMTYHVNETTIEGECESVYTVIPEIKCNAVKSTEGRHLEAKDKGQCVQVTKSVNFDMCKQRPDLRYNHYRGEQMDTSSSVEHKEQRAIEQSTIVQSELKKDEGSKYVLRFARTISHQTLHLTEKSAMMAVSIGELQLKAIKKPTPNAAEVESRKSATNLMHSLEFDELLEKFATEGNDDYLKIQPYLTERNIPDVIVSICKKMGQSFVGNSQDEWSMESDSAAHQFTNLVKILRHATTSDLDKAEERLFQKDEDIPSAQQKTTVERLYTDALALSGTKACIERLMRKVEEKQLSEKEAAAAIQKLARNVQVVGQESLQSVWVQCQKAKQGSTLQHACVLSWARMANTMCSRNENHEQGKKIGDVWAQDKQRAGDEKKEPRCSEFLKSELVKNAKILYDEASDDSQQRILALKALGNMGIDTSIQHLEQIVNDRSLPRLERIVAIDALRQMVTQIPRKIRRTLMPVFLDKREYPEVRMNALHLILKAQPDQPTISQIGMETLRESNMNVRTFVVSELKSAANLMRKLNPQAAQQMLNTAQLFKLSSTEQMEQMRRSNSRFVTANVADSLIGFASLYSNDSNLPKELMVQLDASMREHFIPAYMQLGLHQQDVEQLVTKLFDSLGSKSMDEILVRGKRSTLESLYSNPVQTMKQMFEKLRIVARRDPNAQSSLMFYQREKQMDMWFVLIDEKHMPESIKQLFMDGQMDMSVLETQGNHQIKSVDGTFVFETKIKVPTTFGVPVVSTNRMTKVCAIHGSISTELDGNGKYISSGRVSFKNVPKVSLKMVQKLEAFSPLFTAGVQLQHNLDAQIPLTVEARFSGSEGLIVDFKLPEQKDRTYKLLHVSTHPSTLYREWPQKSRVYIEHEERTLFLPQLQDSFVNIDRQMLCPLSQMKLDIRGHIHKSGDYQGLYLGENVIEVHAHVSEQTAKIMRFQVRAGSKSVSGQTIEIQRLMRAFEDKRKQLFKNVKPEEVRMLQEYLQRHNVHANSLNELDIKLMALTSKQSQTPREQIEVLAKMLCDKDMKMCSKEIHFEAKGAQLTGSPNEPWTAHMMLNMARPTMTGVYGSIRSEHVLVHAECELGDKSSKDILTFCAYGRPSQMQIMQWSEVMNARSASRQSQNYNDMDDEDYDRMVMKQMPARLNAKHFTVLYEYQLSPQTLKSVRPYVQYSIMATKPHPIISLLADYDLEEDGQMNNLHGQVKSDLIIDGSRIEVKFNDMRKTLPGWSNPTKFLSRSGDSDYHQMEMLNEDKFQDTFMTNDNDSENKENNLPSRRSFGQRQAMKRFGFEEQSSTSNAQCTLDSSYNVESFDGKKYKIPMTTCYTVLAKDCGSSSKPQYAVLVKKSSEQNSALSLKILVPKKQFILYEKQKGEMIIKMNGVQLREEEYEENGIHKITETKRPTYVLHCSVTGMELRFDGRTVALSISNDYINRQCGVCGHYNLDSEDTLRKEDNTLASSMKEFHSSYLYRGEEQDSECTQSAQQKFNELKEEEYHKRSKFSSSNSDENGSDELVADMEKKSQRMQSQPEESHEQQKKGKKQRKQKKDEDNVSLKSNEDTSISSEFERQYKKIKPIRKTVVVEEQDMICFSIQPQKACPRGSTPILEDAWAQNENSAEQGKGPEVEFYCQPRSSSKARELVRELRSKDIASDLQTMQSNKRMPVPQAKQCAQQNANRMPAEY